MGEKSGTLYYNGVPVGEFPAITLDSKERKSEAALMATAAFSGDIAVTRQRTTCKTRKRFVKLLMAHGYDRNEANAKAKSVRQYRFGRSYQEYYYSLFPMGRFFKTRTVSGNGKRSV